MNRRSALSAALVAAAFLAGAPHAHAQDKKMRVGISLPEAQNPFYVALGRSAVAQFKERGIDATLLSANADVNEQINNINDLVASKVDAILLSPLDTEGPAPAVVNASKAGIPVFMVARTLDKRFGNIWKTFVGIHFDEIGKAKGEWLVKNSKPGKVAMLLGPAGALVMVEQEKFFRQAIEPAGFKVVFAHNSTQTRENGLKLAEDALVANPDLVAIYASNDDLALGVSQAVIYVSAELADEIAERGKLEELRCAAGSWLSFRWSRWCDIAVSDDRLDSRARRGFERSAGQRDQGRTSSATWSESPATGPLEPVERDSAARPRTR